MQWQARGVAMQHLPRVVLVVALGLALSRGLVLGFDRGEPFNAVLKAAQPLIDALVDREVLVPTVPKDRVYRGRRNVVLLGQVAVLVLVLVIGGVDLLSLKWSQARVSVYNHRGLLLRFSPPLITPKM